MYGHLSVICGLYARWLTKFDKEKEKMLDTINNVLGAVDDFVWGVPLIVLILFTGLMLTIRLRGLQFSKLLSKANKLFFVL